MYKINPSFCERLIKFILILGMILAFILVQSSCNRNNKTQSALDNCIDGSSKEIAKGVASKIVFCDGFENKFNMGWNPEVSKNPLATTISKNHWKSGKESLRVELNKTDKEVSSSKRAELSLSCEKAREENWYSISIYLPNDSEEDYVEDSDSEEILMQWHNLPDRGEEWTSPPLALLTKGKDWVLNRFWDAEKISSNKTIKEKGDFASYPLGSYKKDKGKWVDWKFHIKWGFLPSQNPKLEVFKNGLEILNLNGLANTTNDIHGNYLKIGIYKWEWAEPNTVSVISKRVVYYDDVKIENVP